MLYSKFFGWFLAAIVLPLCLGAASAASLPFEDDFETIAVGDYPDENGWQIMTSGQTAYVSSNQAVSGTRSFRLHGSGGWVRCDYIHLDRADIEEGVTYETWVYLSSEDADEAVVGFGQLYYNQLPTYNKVWFARDGYIKFGGATGINLTTWQADTWYKVRVVIDYTALQADVYLNDVLFADDVATKPIEFDDPSYGHIVLDKFVLLTPGVAYFDDVRMAMPSLFTGFTFGRDNYQFRNEELTWLGFLDGIGDLFAILGGDARGALSASVIAGSIGLRGYCAGMSETAALYYVRPESKPFPEDTYSYSEEQAIDKIRFYQLYGGIFMALKVLNNPPDTDYRDEYDLINQLVAEDVPVVLYLSGGHGAHANVGIGASERTGSKNVHLYEVNDDSPYHAVCFYEDASGALTFNGYSPSGQAPFLDRLHVFDPRKIADFMEPFEELVERVSVEWELWYASMWQSLHDEMAAIFTLACPCDALITDQFSRRIGTVTGLKVNEIPGAEILSEGEIEIFKLPAGLTYSTRLSGLEEGTADVQIFLTLENPRWAREIQFEDLALASGSVVTFDFSASGASAAVVDLDGTGILTQSVEPTIDKLVVMELGITQVPIDIKPGDDNNRVNLGSSGVIPVAVLSTPEFDGTQVNPETVAMAGSSVAVRGRSNKYLATKEDVNGDGLDDLLLHVETENLNAGTFQQGCAIFQALTFSGQPVEGVDGISIVPQ